MDADVSSQEDSIARMMQLKPPAPEGELLSSCFSKILFLFTGQKYYVHRLKEMHSKKFKDFMTPL